ncbi:MAG: hypothetical protein J7K68_02585, partial [Candidatus Diapherotrites archaeon]|nr:hypothetical protein [Candidatus Diapherotrites archaeon]
MKFLLIGNGAREHAIAEAIKRSPRKPELVSYMKSKNPGIVSLSDAFVIGKYDDFDAIEKFVRKTDPNIAVIGPEGPLEKGVVDFLEELGVGCVGPKKELAQLETSKSFTRELLEKYKIPGNPRFKVFFSDKGIEEFIGAIGGDFVVKADGLMGGKGVKVFGEHLKSVQEGIEYAIECIERHGKVVIEEKLIGEEFSLMSFVDGKDIKHMIPVQDHKRAYENDKGPNCYSEDTEILTRRGWKTFNKLKKDDEVAVFSPNSKVFWFEKPQKIYWMRYKGKMINFKNRNIDLLVTPNHRMLLQQRKGKGKQFVVEAKNFKGEHYIYQSAKWEGKDKDFFILPEYDYKFNRKLRKRKINFLDWVKFMAIYLSEGYTTKENRVYIC